MAKIKITYVPIRLLKPASYNPRTWNTETMGQVKESLNRFEVVDPLIVNMAKGREYVVIGGHLRLEAAKQLGLKELPCAFVNIPDLEREKELNLRLNRNVGDWNFDLLKDFDETLLQSVGFDEGELDEAFGLEVDDQFDADKEAEKILRGEKLRTASGQLWQLGDHKLYIGDSTDKKSWAKLFGKEERFDFLFSDPPYRIGYGVGNRKQKTKDGFKVQKVRTYPTIGATDKTGRAIKGFGHKQNRIYLGVEMKGGVPEYDEWLSLANEYQNPKGANVMIFENWKNTPELWRAMEKYWRIANMVIWWLPNRSQGFSARHKFFSKYDVAPLAGDGVMNQEYERELEEYLHEKGQKLLDTYEVILYGKQGESAWDKEKGTRFARVNDHITWTADTAAASGQNLVFGTKPLQTLVAFVKILSPRNGIVAEPYCGSGSTLLACEIMKRQCRAIEIVPLYAEVILRRWEKFTGRKAEKIHD